MGKIILNRGKAWGDMLRSYKVYVDGVNVGSIKHGGVWHHECAVGKHNIQLKIDWCHSPKIDFEFNNDSQTIVFDCKCNVFPLFALIYIFMPSKWISLIRKM